MKVFDLPESVDLDPQVKNLMETAPDFDGAGLGMSRDDVEGRVRWDIAGQEARDDSLKQGIFLQTAGPVRGGSVRGLGSGGFEMVRNGNWDAALNIAADPLGLLGELPSMRNDLGRMSQALAKERLDGVRQGIAGLGVKSLPDYAYYMGANGSGIDVQGSLDSLGRAYEGHGIP